MIRRNEMEQDKIKNVKRTSSQVLELKELISGPLVATIDADTISAQRYLRYLMEIAFESYDPKTGKTGKLRILTFSYKSNEGGQNYTQQVSIPLLTLVPLPLLQVQEADFDFDIQIIDSVTEEKERKFSLVRGDVENQEEDTEPDLKLRASLAPQQREGNTTGSIHQGLTANMKVHVKMRQADMPGGLSNLLNLTANNMQIEEAGTQQ